MHMRTTKPCDLSPCRAHARAITHCIATDQLHVDRLTTVACLWDCIVVEVFQKTLLIPMALSLE